MTTEELFAQMEAQAATEKEYCVIDPITREISVPEVYQKIGVVSDEKTNRIYFQCPRIVGDNVDLTKYGIRVNYQNANGQTKAYPVDDVAVSGDNITFSWLLDRPVTTYKGTINFVVCAIKTSGDEITNEWNTTLAKAEVLEGLEPDITITEDEESIVELLVAQCTQKLTEMNMAIQTSENATNDAKTATQEAVNATEDARSVIEQITKDSYLHTALETFINEVTATPTAYGNALVEKIEGYIRQEEILSPDNPQFICGTGFMGFFDGELSQGSYDRNGYIITNQSSVCNANKIHCKQGDTVKISIDDQEASIYVMFFKNGNFLKSIGKQRKEFIVDTDANEIGFYATKYPNLFPVSSAKHITVTINGMYAICVKSVGKNLSYHDKTIFSPIRCEYISDFGMLIQKTISNTTKSKIKIQTYLNRNYSSQIIGGLDLGKHSVKIQKTENFNFISVVFNGNVEDAYVPFYIGDIENGSYFYISFNFVSDEINKGIIEGLMITTEENTDFDFIPYQSNTTYVPISYPMFEGDQLIKRNMEYKILRKNGFAVFDGSEGEALTSIGVSNGFSKFLFDISDAVVFNKSDKVYCSNFAVYADVSLWTNPTKNACVIGVSEQAGRLCFTFDGVSSEEELKAWLQSNPIIVVYKFTTPIEEEFTPEAQKAIHSIMACDEQTKIEIVGVPTDVEVQNQFLLPRNIDGALNTTAFATSKRNEITLEEQAQQLATMVTQAITLAKAEV